LNSETDRCKRRIGGTMVSLSGMAYRKRLHSSGSCLSPAECFHWSTAQWSAIWVKSITQFVIRSQRYSGILRDWYMPLGLHISRARCWSREDQVACSRPLALFGRVAPSGFAAPLRVALRAPDPNHVWCMGSCTGVFPRMVRRASL
jgi:hypothetical protein